jgi:hypothetical protein
MGRYKKDFVLCPRTMKDGGEVWYYRAYDAEGHRISGQSTRLISEKKAKKYCEKLLREGRLIPTKTPTLRQRAEDEHWWQWGKCRYLLGQLARSEEEAPAVSRHYADDALRDLKALILPAHCDSRLDEITPKHCEDDTDTESGASIRSSGTCAGPIQPRALGLLFGALPGEWMSWRTWRSSVRRARGLRSRCECSEGLLLPFLSWYN